MTEAQVQSKDIEEVENKEDFSNDEMFVNLSIRQICYDLWPEIPRVTPIQTGAS